MRRWIKRTSKYNTSRRPGGYIFTRKWLKEYICDRLWENPPSDENKICFVMVKFIIYGPLALYCANFKAIAFMTPEEQLLERSR